MEKEKIALYDFDGTVTNADTLLAFIRYAYGTPRMLWGFLLYSPLLVLMKLRLYNNGKAKQHIFRHFFAGWTLDHFNSVCMDFARDCPDLIRPLAKRSIEERLKSGWKVFLVSASIDNWVWPFFFPWAMDAVNNDAFKVLGTEIEVKDGRLTGRFLTANCYGPEKVRRVREELRVFRNDCYIVAYGDSRGDREMLRWADEAHFKPFRTAQEPSDKEGETNVHSDKK